MIGIGPRRFRYGSGLGPDAAAPRFAMEGLMRERGGRGCVGSSGLIKPLSVARRAWSWWWLLSGTASRKG